jgi:hypothetical protein
MLIIVWKNTFVNFLVFKNSIMLGSEAASWGKAPKQNRYMFKGFMEIEE